jgi:hypothetical protein
MNCSHDEGAVQSSTNAEQSVAASKIKHQASSIKHQKHQ